MDDDDLNKYKLDKTKIEESSQSKLFFTIVMGIIVGSLAVFILYTTFKNWEAEQFEKEMRKIVKQSQIQQELLIKKLEAQKVLQEERRKVADEQNRLNREALEKKKAAIKQASETCNYWYKETVKERTPTNLMHREQSCALYTKLAH